MCGIFGASSRRDVQTYLLSGLERLEYRGYDSTGYVLLDKSGSFARRRVVGRVDDLKRTHGSEIIDGTSGLAHTRWATHGKVTERNAHPHLSKNAVAVVCNGILENYLEFRTELNEQGYHFHSDTDVECIAHRLDALIRLGLSPEDALKKIRRELLGAVTLGVMSIKHPGYLFGYRGGPPLLVGIGEYENFLASDLNALRPFTRRYMVLEQDDVVMLNEDRVVVWNKRAQVVHRKVHTSDSHQGQNGLGRYRHHMHKEIHEQPESIRTTIEGRIASDHVLKDCLGIKSSEIVAQTNAVFIIACGSSYFAGLVARHWFERYGIPCQVEIASEFRYRKHPVHPGTLVVAISQSGETADTLGAVDAARRQGFKYVLALCNSAESSLVRSSDLNLLTFAGMEVGVASTKAFTTQLVALWLLVIIWGRKGTLSAKAEKRLTHMLMSMDRKVKQTLSLEEEISQLARRYTDCKNIIYLGRGTHYPIAQEGALKLKETCYIHAQAYAAGELKHGPLALVDQDSQIVVVAPNNGLINKLRSNLQEVVARDGKVLIFADSDIELELEPGIDVVWMPAIDEEISPIIHTVPLQLLAYHIARRKGTDIDKPRNLAKSVTVE